MVTQSQDFYHRIDNPTHNAKVYETTSLFYFCNFQFVVMAFLFSLGHPWKRPIYTYVIIFGRALFFARERAVWSTAV